MLFIFGFVYCPRHQIRIMALELGKPEHQHPLIQDFATIRIREFFKTSFLTLLVALTAAALGYAVDQYFGFRLMFTLIFLAISYFGLQVYLLVYARKLASSKLKK